MWNENNIRNYMLELTNKMTSTDRDIIIKDVKYIPIKIDGRLTKSMGYVQFSMNKSTGVIYDAIKFKFSKRINSYSENQIHNVIGHELIHLLVNMKYKKNMGHNDVWKQHCNKYGISDNQYFTCNLDAEKKYNRYHIYCKECGKLLDIKNKLTSKRKSDLLLYGKHIKDDGDLRIYDTKLDKDIDLLDI